MEKAQKFKVLTGSVCKSHGFGCSTFESSAGKVVDSVASSDDRSCHILKLLSRPCLDVDNLWLADVLFLYVEDVMNACKLQSP